MVRQVFLVDLYCDVDGVDDADGGGDDADDGGVNGCEDGVDDGHGVEEGSEDVTTDGGSDGLVAVMLLLVEDRV